MIDNPWFGLALWQLSYLADYTFTLYSARLYRQGAQAYVAFESTFPQKMIGRRANEVRTSPYHFLAFLPPSLKVEDPRAVCWARGTGGLGAISRKPLCWTGPRSARPVQVALQAQRPKLAEALAGFDPLLINWESLAAVAQLLKGLREAQGAELAGAGDVVEVQDLGQDGLVFARLLQNPPVRVHDQRAAPAIHPPRRSRSRSRPG
jgi:hypothetical protein